MIRPAVLMAALLITGCDQPAGEPGPQTNSSSFDNAAASQSIMQPEVTAENPPAPAPTASTATADPQSVTITFARGAALDDAGRAALDQFAASASSGTHFIVRGHSDSSGSDAANLIQSRLRADAVAAYMVAQGIDADQITVVALGERRPVAPNANLDGTDNAEGRARNRRVEVEAAPGPDPTNIGETLPKG